MSANPKVRATPVHDRLLTEQIERVDGEVKAAIAKWKRFLIVGSEGGSYYHFVQAVEAVANAQSEIIDFDFHSHTPENVHSSIQRESGYVTFKFKKTSESQ